MSIPQGGTLAILQETDLVVTEAASAMSIAGSER